MKVCIFVFRECDEHYIPARKVARILVKAGYDVRIIAVLGKDMPAYEETDGFRILRVRLTDLFSWRIVRLLGSPRRFIAEMFGRHSTNESATERLGAREVDPVNATRAPDGWHPLSLCYEFLRFLHDRLLELISKLYHYGSYLEYYCKSYQLARRESADIYYAIDLATLPGAWVCKVLRGGKLLYDSRELWLDYRVPPRSKMNRFFVKRCESFLIRRTDANVAAGVSVGKELSRKYSIPQPVVLLNVPEYRPFEHSTVFRDKLGIPAGQRVLLCMGTLRPDLGIEQAIYSLNYLSNCSLVIFGFGPESYLSELKKVIRNEGLAERVYFSPGVPWDEVTRYAMSADVGLVLQQNVGLNYYYVSPCKLFEYIVAGLPIVGSNLPDLKMYIEGYNIGVTCDQTNPREIADAMNYILSDDKRYSEMKKNALEAAKILNWDNESSKLIALCEKLSRRG